MRLPFRNWMANMSGREPPAINPDTISVSGFPTKVMLFTSGCWAMYSSAHVLNISAAVPTVQSWNSHMVSSYPSPLPWLPAGSAGVLEPAPDVPPPPQAARPAAMTSTSTRLKIRFIFFILFTSFLFSIAYAIKSNAAPFSVPQGFSYGYFIYFSF